MTLGAMSAASPEPTRKEGAEECTTRTKAMYDAQDFAGAAREGTRALEISGLADVALMRARALLHRSTCNSHGQLWDVDFYSSTAAYSSR